MLTTVFVSSTFRDMHPERDAIRVKVTPAVNAEARRYGDAVSMCDLRWGIDTAEMDGGQSARKVLRVCLDEIDRCRPYMIVILGYRYGWMPGEALIRETSDTRAPFAPPEEDISVTALEIEYGSLADPEKLSHTLFYFREIEGPCPEPYRQEDERHRRKLDALRARIEAIPGAHVRVYRVHGDGAHPDDMETFASMVTRDLTALLRVKWNENAGLDRWALDQKKQWDYAREKAAQFTARADLLDRCLGALTAGRSVALTGTPGSGKSTLAAQLAFRLREGGFTAVPVFCGNTALVGAGADLVRCAVWTLENVLGITEHMEDRLAGTDSSASIWLEYLHEMIRRCDQAGEKPVCFLFDGLDQLIRDDVLKDLAFLPRRSGSVRFFISSVSFDTPPENLVSLEAGPLPAEEKGRVVSGVLKGLHRELSAPVIGAILAKPGSSGPLYISLIVQRLLMMNREDFAAIGRMGDGMAAITAHQLRLVASCADDAPGLAAELLGAASRQVGGDAMRRAILYLAVSRHGLRLPDLEALLTGDGFSWIPLDAAAFLQYMGGAFIIRNDGRVDFSHKSIREGILSQAEDIPSLHGRVIDHLYSLPPRDEVACQELVWHVIQGRMKEELSDAVIRLDNAKAPKARAVADVAECAIADGGEWLAEVIEITASTPGFSFFSHFLLNDVWFSLFNSMRNMAVKQRLAEAILDSTRKKDAYLSSNGLDWDLSIALERLIALHLAYHTPEHSREGVRCGRLLLESRESMADRYTGLDTPEKRRRQFELDKNAAGLEIVQQVTDDQIRGIFAMLAEEYRRGVAVAHEHLAGALESLGDDAGLEEAAANLKASVELRDAQLDRGMPSYGTMSRDDLAQELSDILCRLTRLYREMGGDENLMQALECCRRAVRICRELAEREPSDERKRALYEAYMEYAGLQQVLPGGDLDEAIALCLECERFYARQDVRERSPGSAENLAVLYDLMGNLFRTKNDPASLKAAEECYEKAHFYATHVFAKTEALSAAVNAAVIKRKLSGFHGEMPGGGGAGDLALLAESCESARRSGGGIMTPAVCDRVNDTLKTLKELAEKPVPFFEKLSHEMRKRIAGEAELLRYANLLEAGELSDDRLRALVVSLNECADSLAEGPQINRDQWPEEILSLLARFGLTAEKLCAGPVLRAYAASGLALKAHRELCGRSGTDSDLENLVVSLFKYGRHCFMVNPEEAARINEETLRLASDLYHRTGHEKLAAVIAGASMLRDMFSGHHGGWEHAVRPEESKRRDCDSAAEADLLRRRRELEEELKACTGSGTAVTVKRCRLLKQLEEIDKQIGEAKASSPESDEGQAWAVPGHDEEKRRELLREKQSLQDQLDALTGGGALAVVRRHKLKKELQRVEEALRAMN